MIMKPVFSQAKLAPKRIVFAEGEDERVLRAVQVVRDEGSPGRSSSAAGRKSCAVSRGGAASARPGDDFEVIHADDCAFLTSISRNSGRPTTA
jgi:malate dehydrogenase (oxaloacetate-decarboxylating)(NADP+)